MDNEQQRVDVLQRMDAFIGSLQAIHVNTVSLEEARAAVAELIDKASALRSAHEAFQAWKKSAPKDASAPRSILEMNVHAKAMLFAALANVGAAK